MLGSFDKLYRKRLKLDASLSFTQADKSTACGFRHTHTHAYHHGHHHHLLESCGHTHTHTYGSWSVICSVINHSAVSSILLSGQADLWRLRDGADGRHPHEADRLRQRVAALHPGVHIARHAQGFLWLLHQGEPDLGRNKRRKKTDGWVYSAG